MKKALEKLHRHDTLLQIRGAATLSSEIHTYLYSLHKYARISRERDGGGEAKHVYDWRSVS